MVQNVNYSHYIGFIKILSKLVKVRIRPIYHFEWKAHFDLVTFHFNISKYFTQNFILGTNILIDSRVSRKET